MTSAGNGGHGSAAKSGAGGTSTSGAGGAAGTGAVAGTSGAPPPDFDLTLEPDAAVTYMIDPAHSGAQLGLSIDPPLNLIWSRRFDGAVSYPLIVGERVFVTANGAGLRIPTVYALDAATGETLWQATPFGSDETSTSAQLAYDRGRVFAADWRGHVAAFDAETGATAWSVTLDTYAYVSFPVAVGGAVFVIGPSSDNTHLYALNEQDGSIVYRMPSQLGDPTIGDGSVFATSGCFETSALDLKTGAERWHYVGECYGGGGGRTGFWANYLFVADTTPIGVLDTVNGGLYRTLDPPGIVWPMTFGKAPLAAEARDTNGANALVTYNAGIEEQRAVPLEHWPRLPVLSTKNHAYVLFAEENTYPFNLAAVDPDTGATTWESSEKDAIPADPDWINQGGNPYEGIAAGSERIVIGVNRTVAVYASLEVK